MSVGEATPARLISGNEAIALSAFHHGFSLATGYPGTPSTEILESLATIRGELPAVKTQWAPNEKVALEVGLGAALAGARALVTMKHVGLNVAADTLFSAAYVTIPGALVIISADDPGMASSQNEQDNRRYAIAAGLPMLEPSDSQEAYDFLAIATELAQRWQLPVLVRMTTRVCHSKSVVRPTRHPISSGVTPGYTRDIAGRVMMPQFARAAHRQLRSKLEAIRRWSESSPVNTITRASNALGVITSGVTVMHVREAAPEASILAVGMSHPAPVDTLRAFVGSVDRCIVVEEGDPLLFELVRSLGLNVGGKSQNYRFGELNTDRVRAILSGSEGEVISPARGKAPELCAGCPHGSVFEILARQALTVSGDIGCYTLGALPPYRAMDSVVCMGASIGIGLGLRHMLAPDEARRVVSVIGDGTFIHSGITGLIEMLYNPPPTGHVVVILDNETTAMTGQQEHPGTGRNLNRAPAARLSIEAVACAVGVDWVEVMDPKAEHARFEAVLLDMLASGKTCVLIARRPCLLSARRRKAEEAHRAEQERTPNAVVTRTDG